MGLKQRANHQRWRFQKRVKMFTVWITKNKRRIPVYKMETSHVKNTLNYFHPLRVAFQDVVPKGCFDDSIYIVMTAELKRRRCNAT